jgi:hypothetical protein
VTLNVAGPRESEVPGLYLSVLELLQRNASFFARMGSPGEPACGEPKAPLG